MNEQNNNRMVTVDDVAGHFQISRYSLLRAVRRWLISAVRIGRLLRFDMSQVLKALEAKSNVTVDQKISGGDFVDHNDHQSKKEVLQ